MNNPRRWESFTFGSVCSGIEAASVAWEPIGGIPAWFAEIERFPSAVLAHHWPHVPNLGDMRAIPELIRSGSLYPPDVLVGGTPCQSFSVAGLRGGLEDPRGMLTLTYCQILEEMTNARTRYGMPPPIALWENVPGVLSDRKTNGFGNLLAALGGFAAPLETESGKWPRAGMVYGPTRRVAWAVLDAQFFGVAQRRRRVFCCAADENSIRNGGAICPSKILAIGESGGWGVAPGGEPKKENTPHVGGRAPLDNERTGAIVAHMGKGATGACDVDAYSIIPWRVEHTLENIGTPDPEAPYTVRKLTPEECEVLQGFPPGHTKISPKSPDSARYKALGNSMAVPVMRWIGMRICGRAPFAVPMNNQQGE